VPPGTIFTHLESGEQLWAIGSVDPARILSVKSRLEEELVRKGANFPIAVIEPVEDLDPDVIESINLRSPLS